MSLPKPWPDPTPVDEELLALLRKGVVEYDEPVITSVCQTVIDRKMDVYMAIFEGLVAGMDEVGQLFDCQEYFVPELLMCADALYKGLDMLRPHIQSSMTFGQKKKGTVIIGTIEGDIHDIGKNLVKMVLDIAGFDVRDLGSDVPIGRFIKETADSGARLVMVSTMMTSCLPRVAELVEGLRKAAPDARIMVGGAYVNDGTVTSVGADGSANNAHGALRAAVAMISATRNIEKRPI